MAKPLYTVEFTWSEAMNLLTIAAKADTSSWTPASRGALQRAMEKIATALPMDDPNSVFLVVRGQEQRGAR